MLHERTLKVEHAAEGGSAGRARDTREGRPIAREGTARPKGAVSRNLFVANINEHTTEDELRIHFEKFGRLAGIKMLPQKAETKSAFVDFETVEDAVAAHAGEGMLRGFVLRTDYNSREPRANVPEMMPSHFDDRRGPPPGRFDDRGPPPSRSQSRGQPPRYEERGGPRYESRPDEREPFGRFEVQQRGNYDDERRGGGYPPQQQHPQRGYDERFDDRRYERGPPARYEDERGPPPGRFDDYDRRGGPPMRERDYYDDRRCAF